MPNEKEVKDAARKRSSGAREALCSSTGRACKCGAGAGCTRVRSAVDPIPKDMVRWLRTARIRLVEANDNLDQVTEDYLIRRAYPGPEVREIRRKVQTAIAMIDELGGEL